MTTSYTLPMTKLRLIWRAGYESIKDAEADHAD